MRCYDGGALRAYLDNALPAAERNSVAAHISLCAACQGLLEEQRALTARVAALLPIPAAAPDPQLALARFRESHESRIEDRGSRIEVAELRAENQRDTAVRGPWSVVGDNPQPTTRNIHHPLRRTIMRTASFWSGPRRALFAGLVAVAVLLSLLALPPLRAVADQLLQVFRVQKVVFVPISADRINELKQLNFDPKTLFTGQPEGVGKPAAPRPVESPAAAAAAAGISLQQPTAFPSTPLDTKAFVHDGRVIHFQVDVASARQLLSLLGVDDVTLPDSLGASPITVDASPLAEIRYHGDNYTLTLIQGRSPSVSLPDGVDTAQLGKAALRVLGLDADQAEAMSRQIDWNSTLVVPFPSDIHDVRQVQIGDTPGMLVGGGDRGRGWSLYWQEGDRMTVLQGQGRISDAEMIAAAESLR
jgi:putative zinc finger protein